MKKILIDTNAWMVMAEFKVDLFSELARLCDFPYRIYILGGIRRELKKFIKEQGGKEGRNAKLVLSLVKAKKVKTLRGEGEVDDLLVKHSQEGDLILTQDKQLKKRLARPYLTIRQKKYVMMVK